TPRRRDPTGGGPHWALGHPPNRPEALGAGGAAAQHAAMETNVASILGRSAALRPSHVAIVAGEREIDFAALDLFARLFAGGLQSLGVAPGERVALVLPNVPQFSVAYFGCHYAANPVV